MNISKFVWIIILIIFNQIKLHAQVNWSEYDIPLNCRVYELEFSIFDQNTIYCIYPVDGSEMRLIKSTNLGVNWEEISTPPNTSLFFDPTDSTIIYNFSPSSLYKSADGGINWLEINTPTTYTVDGFDVDANGNLWGCYNNDLLKSVVSVIFCTFDKRAMVF